MGNYSSEPTQFQDINTLLFAIDWLGRVQSVYSVGKFLHEQVEKLMKRKKTIVMKFWDGTIGGLIPIISKDGKWKILPNADRSMECLACFKNPVFLFNFYDSPSAEIIPICRSCTKAVLQKMRIKEELFSDEQREIWKKVRFRMGLTADELKIYKKYCR